MNKYIVIAETPMNTVVIFTTNNAQPDLNVLRKNFYGHKIAGMVSPIDDFDADHLLRSVVNMTFGEEFIHLGKSEYFMRAVLALQEYQSNNKLAIFL